MTMLEKRRSNSSGQSSGSDTREKGLHQDIVSAVISPFLSTPYVPRRMP